MVAHGAGRYQGEGTLPGSCIQAKERDRGGGKMSEG